MAFVLVAFPEAHSLKDGLVILVRFGCQQTQSRPGVSAEFPYGTFRRTRRYSSCSQSLRTSRSMRSGPWRSSGTPSLTDTEPERASTDRGRRSIHTNRHSGRSDASAHSNPSIRHSDRTRPGANPHPARSDTHAGETGANTAPKPTSSNAYVGYSRADPNATCRDPDPRETDSERH